MSDLHNPARGVNEWSDTYSDLGKAPPAKLMQLPLRLLDPWQDANGNPQPFDSYAEEELNELAENIRVNGVIEPICVRPRPNGRFQIIAGHHRVRGSDKAGLTHIPALVQELDDNQATILMVDSNLKRRQRIKHSEKAFAYLLRMKAAKDNATRAAGRPTKNSTPVVSNYRSDEIVAEESGESREQVRRYIRLTALNRPLLNLVDNEKLSIRAGVELSYLQPEEQDLLLQVMDEEGCKAPSQAQAGTLRQLSQQNKLDKDAIKGVLIKPKKVTDAVLKLPAHRIQSFFPSGTSPEQMEAEIYAALLAYKKGKVNE